MRTANVIAMAPGVEVLTLDRESFLKLIGDLEPLLKQKRTYQEEDIKRRSARAEKDRVSPTKVEPPALEDEFAQIQLRQLKRIATLGVGGFGRVELVSGKGEEGDLIGNLLIDYRLIDPIDGLVGWIVFSVSSQVSISGDKSRTFALKALKKKHIVDTRQQVWDGPGGE